MNIDKAVAVALEKDFDILEAVPKIRDVPMNQIPMVISIFVDTLHREVKRIIDTYGREHITACDHVGLCLLLEKHGVDLPVAMLGKMCDTICTVAGTQVKMHKVMPGQYVGTDILTEDPVYEGKNIFWVQMTLSADDFPFYKKKSKLKTIPTTK